MIPNRLNTVLKGCQNGSELFRTIVERIRVCWCAFLISPGRPPLSENMYPLCLPYACRLSVINGIDLMYFTMVDRCSVVGRNFPQSPWGEVRTKRMGWLVCLNYTPIIRSRFIPGEEVVTYTLLHTRARPRIILCCDYNSTSGIVSFVGNACETTDARLNTNDWLSQPP